MRVVFASFLGDSGKSGWQRQEALRLAGHEPIPFAFEPFYPALSLYDRILNRVVGHRISRVALQSINQSLVKTVVLTKPEIVWIEKGLDILPGTLEAIRANNKDVVLVSFQDDDPFGPRNEEEMWRNFVASIPHYDINFVKKEIDREAYIGVGARRVEKFMHGVFDPIFRPYCEPGPTEYDHEVSFVGTPLDHRVKMIGKLLTEKDFELTVYGNSWHRTLPYYRHRDAFRGEIVADEYAKLISRSKISLGFVSSSNRDEYSMRSFEIPASRGFFLAERTLTHQQLFAEGREAEFFSSYEECRDKIRYYLNADAPRERIRDAGYARSLKSDFSLVTRMRDAIQLVRQ